MTRGRLFAVTLVLCAAIACGGRDANDQGTVQCKGETRTRLNCASEVKYDGITTSGGASVLSIASANAKYEEVALRRINENVEKYVATQARLCNEYNACVVDDATYHTEAKSMRELLMGVAPSVTAMSGAESEGDRKKALTVMYAALVPAEQRPEDVEFKMSIDAELPPELAAGRTGTFVVRPNEPLPTGARVTFTFEVSKNANLYIFQNSPATGLSVLFPDARIGTTNPLAAGAARRIPDGTQAFRLNDKDLGTEWVYVAVSTKPIATLQSALGRVSSGQITKLGQDVTLSTFATIAPGRAAPTCKARALELVDSAPAACAKTRGLVLDDPESTASRRASLTVRTDPGDDTIVKAFPLIHVSPQDFARASASFNAATPDGRKSRGIIME